MEQPIRYAAEVPKSSETLGVRLQRMRLSAGLSQSELARRAGVGRNTIIRIESDDPTSPTLRTLERIARACGRPVTELTEKAFSESTLNDAIEDLLRLEAVRPVVHPSEAEIAWLRRLPNALWRQLPPNGEVLAKLIQAERLAEK